MVNAMWFWLTHADKMIYGHVSLRLMIYRIIFLCLCAVAARRSQRFLAALWATTAQSWPIKRFESSTFFRLLFIAVVCHFYRLGNFLLSIDDEWATIRTDPSPWVIQGRWTVYWFERLVMTHPAIPFLPDALYCLAIAVAYALVLKSHRIEPGPTAYLLFPIFCAFPSLTVLGEFYANVPTLGLGFVLCAVAVLFTPGARPHQGPPISWFMYALQSMCIAVAVGCYQPFILVFFVFAIGSLLCRAAADASVGSRALLRAQGTIVLQMVAGFVLYQLLQRGHLWWLSATEGYTSSLMRPDRLFADFSGLLKQVFGEMAKIYGGESNTYGIALPAVTWTMILGLIGLLASQSSKLMQQRTLVLAVFSLELLCIPFTFLLVAGGNLPMRTLLAVPYVVWLLAVFAPRQRTALFRAAGFVCIIACAFEVLYINSIYAAQMVVTQQRDRSFAAEIYQRLQDTHEGFSLAKSYKVDLFGMPPVREPKFPSAYSSTTAASFFNWDNGNPWRMLNYMNLLGYDNIHAIEFHEREALTPLFAKMPIWPAEGSVRWQGDTALVRLGAAPGVFHAPFVANH